jgi:hypothetical protein
LKTLRHFQIHRATSKSAVNAILGGDLHPANRVITETSKLFIDIALLGYIAHNVLLTWRLVVNKDIVRALS